MTRTRCLRLCRSLSRSLFLMPDEPALALPARVSFALWSLLSPSPSLPSLSLSRSHDSCCCCHALPCRATGKVSNRMLLR